MQPPCLQLQVAMGSAEQQKVAVRRARRQLLASMAQFMKQRQEVSSLPSLYLCCK